MTSRSLTSVMFLRYDHCKLHARSQDLYPEVTMHMLGSARVTFIMHTADTCFDSFHVNHWCEIVLNYCMNYTLCMEPYGNPYFFFEKNVFRTLALF